MLFCETSSGFELDNIKNAAILRDFLNVWTWQRQKRSNPARLLLEFSKLTIDNIKNAAILRDFLNVWTWQRQKRSNSARLLHFSKLTIDNIKNAAILRDFLSVWTWQRQKRSNSARLLHFSKLTASKTKEFCETSFKNGKLSAELTTSYQCVLLFFQSICLRYCACHEKVMPGYEVLHLSRKIISANLKIWYSKMQPL